MLMLTAAKKQQMGIESRKRAHIFEPSRVLDRYETLLGTRREPGFPRRGRRRVDGGVSLRSKRD